MQKPGSLKNLKMNSKSRWITSKYMGFKTSPVKWRQLDAWTKNAPEIEDRDDTAYHHSTIPQKESFWKVHIGIHLSE